MDWANPIVMKNRSTIWFDHYSTGQDYPRNIKFNTFFSVKIISPLSLRL